VGPHQRHVADVLELPNHEVPAALKEAWCDRGALVRGLGRSYGDAAQNAGGLVLRLFGSAHQAVLDPRAGTVTVPAGVSIDDLLRVIVPRGFFVPVTPGTRFVTIGGAIASDIHGKNHHGDGFVRQPRRALTLLLADGSQQRGGPTTSPTCSGPRSAGWASPASCSTPPSGCCRSRPAGCRSTPTGCPTSTR
jgi:FAD/FMN-containing dehydrogenase